jgi:hypothetical protein
MRIDQLIVYAVDTYQVDQFTRCNLDAIFLLCALPGRIDMDELDAESVGRSFERYRTANLSRSRINVRKQWQYASWTSLCHFTSWRAFAPCAPTHECRFPCRNVPMIESAPRTSCPAIPLSSARSAGQSLGLDFRRLKCAVKIAEARRAMATAHSVLYFHGSNPAEPRTERCRH